MRETETIGKNEFFKTHLWKEFIEPEIDSSKEINTPLNLSEIITFVSIEKLSQNFQSEISFLQSSLVADRSQLPSINIVTVKDEYWHKGDQPSESHVEQGYIVMKESFLKEGSDKLAWLIHEVLHTMIYEQLEQNDLQKKYQEIISSNYPNNSVEKIAFLGQFLYLINIKNYNAREILDLILELYQEGYDYDADFFQSLTDMALENPSLKIDNEIKKLLDQIKSHETYQRKKS